MTDPGTRRKSGAMGRPSPVAALYDPVLFLELPSGVSAETGMNALAHGVEAAYSPARTPEAEVLGLACVREVGRALPLVVDDPFDIDARHRMLRAPMFGGRALQNSTLGVHHGLASWSAAGPAIGHGLANAVLLAHAVRFNGHRPRRERPSARPWATGTTRPAPSTGCASGSACPVRSPTAASPSTISMPSPA